MSALKETNKIIKVGALYDPNPQNNLFWSLKKPKKMTLKSDNIIATIEGGIENICCSDIWVDLKHVLNHNLNPMKVQFLP